MFRRRNRSIANRFARRDQAQGSRTRTRKSAGRISPTAVSEREARGEADAARVELEHASRAKDEFLQMVSHEFRTPLTTIKTLVRVLKHDGETEAERNKHLDTIAAETSSRLI